MGKAIIVLEKMPDYCHECMFECEDGWDHNEFCGADPDYKVICNFGETTDTDGKPDWCPLKELPKKLPITADIDYITGYNTGWNDCIEHIEED